MRRAFLLFPPLLLLFHAACDQSGTEILAAPDGSVSTVSDGGLDAAPEAGTALKFGACPGGYSGACATMDVPLDWNAPGGKTIPVLVDRVVSTAHPRGQLWLLQGGPGGTAADMVPLGRDLAGLVKDLDVYTFEHRGVGASTRLGCVEESADGGAGPRPSPDGGIDVSAARACLDAMVAQWGTAGLAGFSTTNAAHDLGAAIERVRPAGQEAYVLGVSYGTYWAQRYLQLYPTQATGVILDSIVPMEGEKISMFDLHFDPQAQKIAELCKADALCSTYMGADPWALLQTIRDEIPANHCPGTFDQRSRRAVSALLQSWAGRAYAFALMFRYHRCAANDVAALQRFASVADGLFRSPNDGLASPSLGLNVIFSELWEEPPPPIADMLLRSTQAVFPADVSDLAYLQPTWPPYPKDKYIGSYATSTTPMLMLNGTLDCQTPIETASRVKAHYTAPNQTFVEIPYANHGTVGQSPVRTMGAPPCGMQMITGFLKDPKAAVDTTCLSDVAPVAFAGSEQDSTFLLGQSSLWTAAPPLSPEELRGAKMPVWLAELARSGRGAN